MISSEELDQLERESRRQTFLRFGLNPEELPTLNAVMALTFDDAWKVAGCLEDGYHPIRTAMKVRGERRSILRKKLVGVRSEAKRREIYQSFIEGQPDPRNRLIAEAVVRDVEAERGKRGRKPKGVRAMSSTARARESRKRSKTDLQEALRWLRRRVKPEVRDEFDREFPSVAEFLVQEVR